MRKKILLASIIFCTLVLSFALPQEARAEDIDGDKIVFGEEYILQTDEMISGNLIIFGGKVSIEKGSSIKGDIFLSGGSLDIQGEIGGDIVAIGGSLNLGANAVIDGDVNLIGTTFNRSSGAKVKGDINHGSGLNENDIPDIPRIPVNPAVPRQGGLDLIMRPLGALIWAVFLSLSMGAIAVLIGLFIEIPMEISVENLRINPILSLGLGLLTIVAAPLFLIILAITIILLPVALLLSFLIVIALIFAWLLVGYEIGNRLATLLQTSWAQPVKAGVGTILLTFVSVLVWHIPCIGWMFPGLILSVGLGALLLSRFGTKPPTPPFEQLPDSSPVSQDETSKEEIIAPDVAFQSPVSGDKASQVKRAAGGKKVATQRDVKATQDAETTEGIAPVVKSRRKRTTPKDQSPDEM